MQPLPEQPTALFVGVLEPYKNIDGLAAAWRRAAPQLPDAGLRLVGAGTRTDIAESLVRDGLATWEPRLDTHGGRGALDESSVLVLPSRSEGMGRVVIEAQLRGRPVLGSDVGGIPDLVADGVDGVLVEPDPDALAASLVRLLARSGGVARLAAAARAAGERWLVTPGGVRRARARPGRRVRLVVITQRVDPEDPALGATVAKLRALAARVDELVVLDARRASGRAPANVRVKEFGANGQAAARRSARPPARPGARAAGRSPCSRTCRRSTPCSPRR